MKDFLIILFFSIIVVLVYFIVVGRFCHCSSILCPSNDSFRSFIS